MQCRRDRPTHPLNRSDREPKAVVLRASRLRVVSCQNQRQLIVRARASHRPLHVEEGPCNQSSLWVQK